MTPAATAVLDALGIPAVPRIEIELVLVRIVAKSIRAAVPHLSEEEVITEEGFKGPRHEAVEIVKADDLLALATELEALT